MELPIARLKKQFLEYTHMIVFAFIAFAQSLLCSKSNSEFKTCLFSNFSVCFANGQWYSVEQSEPISVVARHPWENNVHDKCDEPVRFEARSKLRSSVSVRISGTTAYVCEWTDHFGHALVQFLVPLLVAIGRVNARLDDFKVLIDDKWQAPAALKVLSVVSKEIVRLSSLPRHIPVCFENFLIGFELTSPIVNNFLQWHDSVDLSSLDLRRARDLVLSLANMPQSSRTCVVTIVDRSSRRMINLGAVVASVRATGCNADVIRFDQISVAEQIAIVHRSTALVTVVGTESHFALFLPDNSCAIHVQHSHMWDVNQIVCDRASWLRCMKTKSSSIPHSHVYESKWDVTVEIADFESKLAECVSAGNLQI